MTDIYITGSTGAIGSRILPKLEEKNFRVTQINLREPAETYVYNAPPTKNRCGLTVVKDKLPEETQRDRIQPDLLNAYKNNISSIRAGRASTGLLDQVKVEVYGDFMPLNQVATVSVQDSSLLNVQVWDKGNVGVVEKAIRTSDLGLNPSSEGNLIRVPLPKLSEERRIELVKILLS